MHNATIPQQNPLINPATILLYSGKVLCAQTIVTGCANIVVNPIAKNITNFKDSVEINGGYYIGRYEAGVIGYDINDIISGNTITKPDGGSINFKSLNNSVNYMQKFLVSLARERYDIYITNGYLINE